MMDKMQLDKIMLVLSLILIIAGIIFLCISIFGVSESTTPLACALGCILLANLITIIRSLRNKDR